MHRLPHPSLLLMTLTCGLLALLSALPAPAVGASYWANLAASRSQVAPGTNSITVHAHGGPWKSYGNHCQAEPGSYVAGAYCKLRFNVPVGLTAGAVGNGGIARGDYRTANANVILRSERPGGNPAGVTDSSGDGTFGHGWQVLGPYVDVGLRIANPITTTSATNWFHINTFDVQLRDPSAPVLQHLRVGSGDWNGPGCVAHSHAWADSGSQVASTSLVNVTKGVTVDSWAVAATGVVSGHPTATDTGCAQAPGTGTFTYRSTARDRAGNASTRDLSVRFDTSAPTAGTPRLGGSALSDGAVVDSSHGYRPDVTWDGVADAHSGIASITTTLDGQSIPHERAGALVRLAPTEPFDVGQHTLRLTVKDAVGNSTVRNVMLVVRDDVAPTIELAAPTAVGGSEPVLDVSASDDHSGLAHSTWTVKVNGATLVAASANERLQADVGYLVDGSHRIEVTIADRSGNVGRLSFEYTADSGDDLPDPPALTGLFVYDSPTEVDEGDLRPVRAMAVRAGRPVSGRVELRAGIVVVASQEIAPNGGIDMSVAFTVPGPLTLHAPSESGLAPATLRYAFRPAGTDDPCAVVPRPASCTPTPVPPIPVPPTSTTTNNHTTINHAPATSGRPGAANQAVPRNVIYFVRGIAYWNGLPLTESGGRHDRVAPRWRLRLIQHRRGVVRSRSRIAFKLWTNEMSVIRFQPRGSVRRTTISPRRQQRTVFVTIAKRSKLGRTLSRSRPGTVVRVRLRVVAIDRNGNRSRPAWRSFRVRA